MLSRSCAGLVIFQQNYPAELICRRVGQDTLEQAIGQAVPKRTHASPRQGNKMRIWTTKPTYFCRQLMDLGVSQDDNLFHCPTLTSRRISTQDSSLCWKTNHRTVALGAWKIIIQQTLMSRFGAWNANGVINLVNTGQSKANCFLMM